MVKSEDLKNALELASALVNDLKKMNLQVDTLA